MNRQIRFVQVGYFTNHEITYTPEKVTAIMKAFQGNNFLPSSIPGMQLVLRKGIF